MADGRLRRAETGLTMDGSTSAAAVSPSGSWRIRSNSAGTAIEVSYNGAAYVTLAGTTAAWSAITAPTADLTLNHANYKTIFNFDGADAEDCFLIQSANNAAGSGVVLYVKTNGASTSKAPFRVDAKGAIACYVDVNGNFHVNNVGTIANTRFSANATDVSNYSAAIFQTALPVTATAGGNAVSITMNDDTTTSRASDYFGLNITYSKNAVQASTPAKLIQVNPSAIQESLTDLYSIYLRNPGVTSGKTLTNYYGVYFKNVALGGTTTNKYSVYVEASAGQAFIGDVVTISHTAETSAELRMISYGDTGVPPIITLHRSRGTSGSPDDLESGDRLGQIRFSGNYDTTTPTTTGQIGAIIQADASGDWDGTNMPADLIFRTRALVSGSAINAMIVTSDRRVVIGDACVHADATHRLVVTGDSKVAYTTTETGAVDVKGATFTVTHSPASGSSAVVYGTYTTVSTSTAQAISQQIGSYISTTHAQTTNVGTIVGQQIDVAVSGGGGSTATTIEGQFVSLALSGKAFTSVYGIAYSLSGGVTGSIGTLYGARIDINNGLMTITNAYALYINTDEGGAITNKYAIVTESGSGKVGFNTITPSADLHHVGSFRVDVGSDATGDIWYRAATTGLFTRLAIGSSGHVLTVAGGLPSWAAPSAGTPAGSGTELQYKNGSSFGAVAGSSVSSGAVSLAATFTVTTSSSTLPSAAIVTQATLTGSSGGSSQYAHYLALVDESTAGGSLADRLNVVAAYTRASAANDYSTATNYKSEMYLTDSSGTQTATWYGFRSTVVSTSGSTLTTWVGFHAALPASGVTNTYGFTAQSGLYNGFGTVTPTSTLHASGTVRFDLGSDATNDIHYRSSGGTLARLAIGSALQVLRVNSGATALEYATLSLSDGSGTEIQRTNGSGGFVKVTSSSVSGADVTWGGLQAQTMTSTATSAGDVAFLNQAITLSPASSSSSTFKLHKQAVTLGTAQTIADIILGSSLTTHNQNALLSFYAVRSDVFSKSSGGNTIGGIYHTYWTCDIGSGTANYAYGYRSSIDATGGTITEATGVLSRASRSAGTFTTFTAFQALYDGTIGTKYGFASSSGFLHGLGTLTPGYTLDVQQSTSATSTISTIANYDYSSTGTAAAGFGLSSRYALESSTTASQLAAQVDVRWQAATHASRSAVYSVKTTANAVTKERMLLGGYKSLTDNTATDLFSVVFSAGEQKAAGGIVVITCIAKKADTTDTHAITETVAWTAGHWNGSSSINVGLVTGSSKAVGGSGAYGLTYSTSGAGGDTLTFRVAADSTLNVATEIYFQVIYGGDAEVTLA